MSSESPVVLAGLSDGFDRIAIDADNPATPPTPGRRVTDIGNVHNQRHVRPWIERAIKLKSSTIPPENGLHYNRLS